MGRKFISAAIFATVPYCGSDDGRSVRWYKRLAVVSTSRNSTFCGRVTDMSGASSYRIFDIKLKVKENISPSLLRCVFEGAEVNCMKLEAPDQRIKLLFPAEDGQITRLQNTDDWYRNYMAIPTTASGDAYLYTARIAC
jgi:hypothetical protein